MAKKKKEKVTEEVAKEQVIEQSKIDNTVEKIEVKKKPTMKKLNQNDEVIKVDLSQPVKENKTEEIISEEAPVEEVIEEKQGEVLEQNTETPTLEEITEEETTEEETTDKVEEVITESTKTNKEISEDIQKLVDFIEDTGGDINDYVALNQDYSKMDNHTLLKEYYKQTKSHLDSDEIDFLMEDSFSYDEELDEERDIKRKKLALKEQVADAKSHLDGLKSKYYEDLKSGSKLTNDQQKAIEFFDRYKTESKDAEVKKSDFLSKTNEVFNDKFKGFEYNIGDKKFRFNIKDTNKVKENQSDINNFTRKFLNKRNQLLSVARL